MPFLALSVFSQIWAAPKSCFIYQKILSRIFMPFRVAMTLTWTLRPASWSEVAGISFDGNADLKRTDAIVLRAFRPYSSVSISFALEQVLVGSD